MIFCDTKLLVTKNKHTFFEDGTRDVVRSYSMNDGCATAQLTAPAHSSQPSSAPSLLTHSPEPS
jgi:hypothetical protein